ncbi:squalene synthase HpnC [Aquabacterium humicola]|uniref:squalene synthase HpnC n=1 Tax=Aquabacterium humicola TaxID=3237377 RepID=UPI0025428A8E|nr:squalene synthase HpnC [Rubrivivax pictus]
MSVDHYENFPVASLLCPARLRPAVRAIYAFARTADDIADEGDAAADQRRAELARFRSALHAALEGSPSPEWPQVFGPLAKAIDRHRLPTQLFDDLLDAFVQDCSQPQYRDRSQLLDYCRRSANPIGRLLLALYEVRDAESLAQSDAICSALQLINFWQDPSVDLARGRNYFPAADARRHGLTLDGLKSGRDDAATQALLRDLVGWAEGLMLRGAPLALRLPGRIGWELRLVIQGGLRILEKIAAMQFRTLSQRPTLGRRDWALLLWRAARMRSHQAPPGWAPR